MVMRHWNKPGATSWAGWLNWAAQQGLGVIRYRGSLTTARLEWYLAMARLSRDGVPVFDAVQTLQREFETIGHPLAPLLREVMLSLRGEEARVPRQASRGAFGRRRTLGLELQGLVPTDEAMLIEAADLSG